MFSRATIQFHSSLLLFLRPKPQRLLTLLRPCLHLSPRRPRMHLDLAVTCQLCRSTRVLLRTHPRLRLLHRLRRPKTLNNPTYSSLVCNISRLLHRSSRLLRRCHLMLHPPWGVLCHQLRSILLTRTQIAAAILPGPLCSTMMVLLQLSETLLWLPNTETNPPIPMWDTKHQLLQVPRLLLRIILPWPGSRPLHRVVTSHTMLETIRLLRWHITVLVLVHLTQHLRAHLVVPMCRFLHL